MSTSSSLPSVQWFNPEGDLISNSRDLKIMNIQRCAMGVYTCVATQFGTKRNISVEIDIIELCEFHYNQCKGEKEQVLCTFISMCHCHNKLTY